MRRHNHLEPIAGCLFASLALVACGGGGGGGGDTTSPPGPGDIVTWAGTGVQGVNGDGLPRAETWLNQPMEVVFSPADDTAYVADWNNHCVRHVTEDGTFENLIGTPMAGDWPCQVPGDAALCEVPLSGSVPGDSLPLNHPMDVAFAGDGSLYVAAWHNHKIERYDFTADAVTVLAGLQKPGPAVPPQPDPPPPAPIGDGGPARTAPLNFPSSIVIQSDGSILVSDERNNRVRRIGTDDARTITTVVGTAPTSGKTDDGIPALQALLNLTTTEEVSGADNPPPGGAITLDADGNLYIADTFHHVIRKVSTGADGVITGADDEVITTVAGTFGQSGYDGDGDAATSAHLQQPYDVEIGPDGALYVADTFNHAVRRVDLTGGGIETIAGTGDAGFSGDGGPAKAAKLREPYGLAFDAAGDLFVADTMNNRIRRVLLGGTR